MQGIDNPVTEAAHRLFSTTWFIVFGGLVATVYLAALLWKILKSDEGFLFGYGQWIVGKWQRSGVNAETAPERKPKDRAKDHVDASARKARRDISMLQRDLATQQNVLKLSRLLDGDLAYLMLNGDWDAKIARAFQTIVSGVTRVVRPVGRCRCGFFILDDEDQQSLIMAAGEGYFGQLPRLALEHSCAGRAYVTGENYYCRDINTDPVYWHSARGRRDYRSIACIPVRTGPYAFGVLCLDAEEPDAFSADDFTFLEVFAGKLAVFCAFHLLQTAGMEGAT